MTAEEKALEIIIRNEETIRDRLFADGYMFDDEFDESMTAPVARKLTGCINEYFRLEEEQYVIRDETNPMERSEGVLYFSECEKSFTEIKEIAKKHYSRE